MQLSFSSEAGVRAANFQTDSTNRRESFQFPALIQRSRRLTALCTASRSFLKFCNSLIFRSIQLFVAIFGNVRVSLIIQDTLQSIFTMTNSSKRPPKLAVLWSNSVQKHEPWSIGKTHFQNKTLLNLIFWAGKLISPWNTLVWTLNRQWTRWTKTGNMVWVPKSQSLKSKLIYLSYNIAFYMLDTF